MKIILCLLALSLSAGVFGQARCGESHRFGGTLIRAGDSERKVVEAREPDRTVRLEYPEGGSAGYRLDFHEYRQTVQIYIRGGVVTRICRIRE